jgi:hypothetical protein
VDPPYYYCVLAAIYLDVTSGLFLTLSDGSATKRCTIYIVVTLCYNNTMLKAYVCYICRGSGQVWLQDFDGEGNTTELCPDCVGRGLPAKIELPVNGPPAAKEMIVESELTPYVPPALEEPK